MIDVNLLIMDRLRDRILDHVLLVDRNLHYILFLVHCLVKLSPYCHLQAHIEIRKLGQEIYILLVTPCHR